MTDTTTTAARTEAKTEAKEAVATDAGSGTETANPASDAPAGYHRGENQKPVTESYRRNWDMIFGNNAGR